MNGLKPKYFLYARKSTEEDDQQIMSIEAQLFELREFAQRENIEVLEEFTESKSAKKPGREVFNSMIERIENGEAGGILAWHPDRLARNSVDGGKVIYLVDTGKIVSLRFPTFWFEPTPQGKFMLQVAFGQSKYYSDNLVENINRGIRQKVRRGEWLTKAPFGYVNNFKTRNIEPDPHVSKIVVRAFEEFATGQYTMGSLALFLAEELGVETKNRTPLAKASIAQILTNRAYLGFTHHHGEYFPGSFVPILDPTLFDAVQDVLRLKSRPRKSNVHRHFPFRGLLTCGECGSSITAQYAHGNGGQYRYYRCTKKKGFCSQKYLQEKDLAAQFQTRLKSVGLDGEQTAKMLEQVENWNKEAASSSQASIQNLKNRTKDTQAKLDKLVSLYIDGEVEKDSYLVKKEELLKTKVSLANKLTDFGRGKNWLEPLRNWILDASKSGKLSESDDFPAIKVFVQKIGTNHKLLDKAATFSLKQPWDEVAERHSREAAESVSAKSMDWWTQTDSNRRHSDCQPDALPTELWAQTSVG